MEKCLPLFTYLIPYLENCQEHSAQLKSKRLFSNLPTCTTLILYTVHQSVEIDRFKLKSWASMT